MPLKNPEDGFTISEAVSTNRNVAQYLEKFAKLFVVLLYISGSNRFIGLFILMFFYLNFVQYYYLNRLE